MAKNRQIQRRQEFRDGLLVEVVRLSREFARKTRFSQAQLSEWYSGDSRRPSEVWIGDSLFISNFEECIRLRRDESLKASRYLGPDSSGSPFEMSSNRIEFERTWSLCLRLHTAAWVGQSLGISRDTTVLRDEVTKLVDLLESMEIRGWGAWSRLPKVVADDFLLAVDEGFARVLTASSRTLPDPQRTAVEELWHSIDDRREIVKNFISQHLPPEIATKLTANDLSCEEFFEVDAGHLLSQALIEYTRHKLRGLDPDLMAFPWEAETRRILAKLESGIESLRNKGHDLTESLSSAVRNATDFRREIVLAEKQLLTIFVKRETQERLKDALYELNRSGQMSAKGLIEEMLTAYAPSLFELMKNEGGQ